MKELLEFFKDVKRIADSMEKRNELLETKKGECCSSEIKINGNEIAAAVVREPVAINNMTTPLVQNCTQVASTVPVNQPVIPTSQTVENYTQEQLALAMGRAMDVGKMADIQNILAYFNVQYLMELPAERYNELALKLKEIGVEV